MRKDMDRRSFLGLSAFGALAAGASLAGCSPKPTKSEPQNAEQESAQNEGIARKEGSEKKECDAVIVGAGAAGLMAALKLSEAGMKVVVVEKGPSAGMSNFALCGGPAACETVIQEQENAVVTLDQLFNYMYDFSRTGVNGKLLRNCLANTGDAVNSMVDLGIPLILKDDTYGVGFRARHMFGTGGIDRVSPIVSAIEANGGELNYNVGAEKIIVENEKAIGIQTDAGIDIMAKHVIICSGGFLGSEEMQLDRLNTKVTPLGNVFSDGTGIRMVLDAGGAWDRNFSVLGNECGAVPATLEGSPFTEDFHNINEHYGYWLFGGLYTDTAGERFIDESKIAEFPLAIGGEALLRAGKAYVVMDSDYYEAVKNEGIYAYLGQPENWSSGPMADYYKTTPEHAEEHLQQGIEEGWAHKANTIAELAEKFSLSSLEATVEAYNKFCDEGVDGDFGKPAAFLKPVKTAPFYIFEYVPSAWGTNGGVKVDSHLRALNAQNKAIEGLYVAGVDQGSVYSMPYYTNEGASVGLALGSGVYVAKEILADA